MQQPNPRTRFILLLAAFYGILCLIYIVFAHAEQNAFEECLQNHFLETCQTALR